MEVPTAPLNPLPQPTPPPLPPPPLGHAYGLDQFAYNAGYNSAVQAPPAAPVDVSVHAAARAPAHEAGHAGQGGHDAACFLGLGLPPEEHGAPAPAYANAPALSYEAAPAPAYEAAPAPANKPPEAASPTPALETALLPRGRLPSFTVDIADLARASSPSYDGIVSNGSARGGSSQPSPRRERRQKQAKPPIYVQARRQADFRAVAPERAMQLFGASDLEAEGGSGRRRSGHAGRLAEKAQGNQHQLCAVAAWTAMSFDSDAVALAFSRDQSDQDILELLSHSEAWRLRSTAVIFAGQALLFGLCLIAGWLSVRAHGDVELGRALDLLEPGLGGATLALAEMSLVGSALRILTAHDAAESMGAQDSDSLGADAERGREKWAKALMATCSFLANCGVVMVCLIATRGTEAIVTVARNTTGEWLTEWQTAKDDTHYETMRLLLGLRFAFGALAAAPALVEAQRMTLPMIPLPLVLPFGGELHRQVANLQVR